ncbi:MAG TPA: DUF2249 domain-containing protein [Planctomycetota bacterium]|jgi:uncharacterized protein (DUF2249 family)|nr:DUF2249 domain-containing protein [Planctomycetota bacterium]
MPTRILDLRGFPPEERNPQVLGSLASLEAGETLLLVSDRDPRAIYHLLRVGLPESFSWLPVADGPPEWRISVTRLGPMRFEGRPSALLRRDQEEILLLASFLLADLNAADPEERLHTLAIRTRELEARIDRHFRWEEEALYPELARLEKAFGAQPFLEEHQALRALVTSAAESLGRGDPDPGGLGSARKTLARLLSFLREHAGREEKVTLPLAERHFPPERAATLLARFRMIR